VTDAVLCFSPGLHSRRLRSAREEDPPKCGSQNGTPCRAGFSVFPDQCRYSGPPGGFGGRECRGIAGMAVVVRRGAGHASVINGGGHSHPSSMPRSLMWVHPTPVSTTPPPQCWHRGNGDTGTVIAPTTATLRPDRRPSRPCSPAARWRYGYHLAGARLVRGWSSASGRLPCGRSRGVTCRRSRTVPLGRTRGDDDGAQPLPGVRHPGSAAGRA
jgi:hypothetical protein